MDADRLLTRSYSEKSGKGCRNPKELDGDLGSSWSERGAHQPFFPWASGVSLLTSRERGRVRFWLDLEGWFQMYINPLIAYNLHAFPSMLPSTPVTPEERPIPDNEWKNATTSEAVNARCGKLVKKSSYTTPARVTPTGLFFLVVLSGCYDHAAQYAFWPYRDVRTVVETAVAQY